MKLKQAVRKTFWHGTSSKHLRSILKQGLLPSGTEAVYSDELDSAWPGSRSFKTYGGVYITPDFSGAYTAGYKATKKHGGNHVMVAVDYETRSPQTLIDEDSLFKVLDYTTKVGNAVNLLEKPPWGQALSRFADYDLPGYFFPSKFSQIVDTINHLDLSDQTKQFLANLVEWFPRAANRCQLQDQKIAQMVQEVMRRSAFHLIEVAHKQKVERLAEYCNKMREAATEANDQSEALFYQMQIESLKRPRPNELTGTFGKLRKAVKELSLLFKEMCDIPKYKPHSLRIMEPVGFRGKNKIECIVESIPRQSKVAGLEVWDVIVRYCRNPQLVNTYLEESPYTNYRVMDWQGKVKQTVFDDYYPYPSDVWGEEKQVRKAAYIPDDEYEDVGYTEEGFWGNAGSGILFTTGEKILLLKRSPYVLEPGTWGIPGGAIPEKGGRPMDALQSAKKETQEELGRVPSFQVVDKYVFRSGAFKFTTFIARVNQEFKPRLNWENDKAEWLTEDEVRRKNLHPGVKTMLAAKQVFEPRQLSFKWGTAMERIAKRHLRRLSHRKTAVRKMFWHGTSSKNLRGILKEGLIPFGTDLVFEGETGEVKRSLGTFGGIYISDQWMTAYSAGNTAWRKKGGHLLMVGCTYETRTPTTLADEDDIISLIEWATGMGRAADITSLNSPFGEDLYDINRGGSYRPGGFDPSKYPEIVRVINTADLSKAVEKYKELLLKNFPRLKRRLKLQQAKIDSAIESAIRAFTLQLLETSWNSSKDRLLEEAVEGRESSYSYYGDRPDRLAEALEQYDEEIALIKKPPVGMRGTFALMRDTVTKLSQILKETTDEEQESFRHNVRVMQPITYRGKNRILCVVGVVEEDSQEIINDWGNKQRYTTITFYYGADPSMIEAFIKPYQERIGGLYRVVNRQGKILKLHLKDFKGNVLPWPTDLWGREP